MKVKAKTIKGNKLEYDNLFFYAIPLENDHLLIPKKLLNSHFPDHKRVDKQLNGLHSVFVSYRDGIFTCALQKDEVKFEQVYFGVEREALHVACDCGMPGETLCEHGYQVLNNLTWGHTGKLDKYYWPGFEPDADGKSKYLNIEISRSCIDIEPNNDYGNLYKRGFGFNKQDVVSFDRKLPEPAFKKEGVHEVIGYQLLYNSHLFYKNHLPLLMPFVGTTTKSGNEISYCKTYLKRENLYHQNIKLSNDQIILNEISFAMYDNIKSIPFNKEKGEYNIQTKDYMPVMLGLWQKAIPKLRFERHIKSTYSHYIKSLPDRPRKTELKQSKITISDIDISFILSDNGDHYQLTPVVKVNGKDISAEYYKVSLFIVEPVTNYYFIFHLIGNLQDEYLLNWLGEDSKKLTVLKQDFESFDKEFLNPLSKCYQVMVRKCKGKVLTPLAHPTIL